MKKLNTQLDGKNNYVYVLVYGRLYRFEYKINYCLSNNKTIPFLIKRKILHSSSLIFTSDGTVYKCKSEKYLDLIQNKINLNFGNFNEKFVIDCTENDSKLLSHLRSVKAYLKFQSLYD